MDHIVPKAYTKALGCGPIDKKVNLQTLCTKCNSDKSSTIVSYLPGSLQYTAINIFLEQIQKKWIKHKITETSGVSILDAIIEGGYLSNVMERIRSKEC